MTQTLSHALTNDTNWQTLANWQSPDTPFMQFEFWRALADTKAIGQDAGWLPLYVLAIDDMSNKILAVMPVFVKGHHQGEYVFDYAWAEAFHRYGVDYYPRLVTSVPYTPVTGQRIWLAEGVSLTNTIWQTLLAGVDDLAKQINASSWHGLFMPDDTAKIATASVTADTEPKTQPKTMQRQGCQFIWHNQNLTNDGKPFAGFDDFLATLTARKRKNIRQERKKIPKQNLTCRIKTGENITDDDWQAFYHCYAMTYAVRGQNPYLSPDFFTQVGKTMPNHLMLAQGLEVIDGHEEIVASSLFFYDDPSMPNATLYGRYWGSINEYDSLHFELCYYQGIEFAIAQGLQHFDPGTQGEHKLIRGFVPHKTHSLHRIYDERFEPAISDFCEQDRERMQAYREEAHSVLPFNVDNMPVFDE